MDKENNKQSEIAVEEGSVIEAPKEDVKSDGNKNKKRKKKIIKAGIWLISAAVVLALLNLINYDALFNTLFGKKTERPEYSYRFYQADYETDILKDEMYLALDRSCSYSNGAITYGNVDLDDYPGTPVIKDYLECMINGDVKGYNALFNENYYKDNKPLTNFPMQRVYNVKVSVMAEPYVFLPTDFEGKYTGTTRYLFSVEYYIQFNTGTVRNDIPSDSSRPLYIEVYESPSGSIKINKVSISSFSN